MEALAAVNEWEGNQGKGGRRQGIGQLHPLELGLVCTLAVPKTTVAHTTTIQLL